MIHGQPSIKKKNPVQFENYLNTQPSVKIRIVMSAIDKRRASSETQHCTQNIAHMLPNIRVLLSCSEYFGESSLFSVSKFAVGREAAGQVAGERIIQ
jgi:hypothetical protein